MFDAADLLSNRARLTPGREALTELASGQRYTYDDLNRRANRLANWLTDDLGIRKGDRVSILAQNSVVYLDLFYGLAKIGAIFAPLNWRLVARELDYIVNDFSPEVLICGPEYTDVLASMQVNIPHVVSVEGAQIEGARLYEDAVAAASDAEPARPELDSESPYCILYTSGTTGRPKGAVIPHRQILFNAINTVASWGLTEHDVSPVFTPMFHAGGLFAFLTPILYIGGRIVLGRAFEVEESLKVIQEEKCTVILGVPTIFQMWFDSPNFPSANLDHVHFFISGGAPCPPSLIGAWRKAKNVVFRQGYGLTEVGANCFSMSDEDSVPKTGSVGKPIFHSEMRVVDEEGKDVPRGQPGELLIKGPHVCSGYWKNPEATAKSIRNGWFYTGDVVRQDEDGFFYIIGRAKDMIISGGENVYAAEVEAVFREHPAVVDAALIGVPDEKWGEVGLIVVLGEKGAAVTEGELKAFCAERLAKYKVPKDVIFTDSLPYSPYGKVVKADLRAKYLE